MPPETHIQEEIRIPFAHYQAAHCESGVCSNLLRHYGIHISEAMAFGMGSGLFFAYLPFIRVNGLPLTTYRCEVGGILKRVFRRMGCKMTWRTFRNPEKAMAALDEKLAEGIPVACRTGGYWLPYFPSAFRFHFNMHNLVVCGKKENQYLISDPVFPEMETCAFRDLQKARFAKGALAPRGAMYYMTHLPKVDDIDFPGAIYQGIRDVCRRMLHTPVPFIGVRGIRYLAGQIQKWPYRLGEERTRLYAGQLIRMQEELGTGGAGFRFMFAAFLQEAADFLNMPQLLALSQKMTAVGDQWRTFAVRVGRICKGRASGDETCEKMASLLRSCAEAESAIYKELLRVMKA